MYLFWCSVSISDIVDGLRSLSIALNEGITTGFAQVLIREALSPNFVIGLLSSLILQLSGTK